MGSRVFTLADGVPYVHTPRPGREKKRGVQRPRVALRVPTHLADYLEGKTKLGVKLTDAILDVLQLGMDLEAAMGDELWELERQAKVEGIMPGTLLGRIARAALHKRK